MRWLPWVRGPWLRGPWLPCLRGPGLRRPWLRGRLRGRQLLRILGILPRVLSSTTYRPDAEKIGSNGLNSRFSQGRFGSNWEVDARIGEVCFAHSNGSRRHIRLRQAAAYFISHHQSAIPTAVVTVDIPSAVANTFANSQYDTNAISSRRPRRMCIIGESCLRRKLRNPAAKGRADPG